MGYAVELVGLDPAASFGDISGQAVATAIYDTLVDTPTGRDPRPALLESFTEAPDRRSWMLKVRPGVRFQDHTPLTADAVKFNLERQRSSPAFGRLMATIKSIDVLDPMTLRLGLDRPYAAMAYLLGGTVGIMVSPKAVQEKRDRFNRDPGNAGTGPYVLKEWTPGDKVVVVRNPDYWGDLKPRLDRITFRAIIDENIRFLALRSGDFDAIVAGSNETLDDARRAGFRTETAAPSSSTVIHLNNLREPFDDARLRRAAVLALDGGAISRVGGFPPDEWGVGLWPKGSSWYAPADPLSYDRAEARRLVTSYVAETGHQASFSLLATSASDVARLLVREWQDAGMDATLDVAPDINSYVLALTGGRYDAAIGLVALEKDPDATAYPLLHSTSGLNLSRYKSAEMDAALDEGRVGADVEARKLAYARVQAILRRDLPFIPGWPIRVSVVFDKGLCTGASTSGGFPSKLIGRSCQ